MPPTLQDVAEAAHVSQATVLRVLNNRHDVAPETVQLVEDAIRRVGYERAARRGGRPVTNRPPGVRHIAASIALLVTSHRSDEIQSPLLGQLMDGIETVAREAAFTYCWRAYFPTAICRLCLDPVQVDGLIVRSPGGGIKRPLPQLPTVWIFRPGFEPAPGDVVAPDNERFARIGANYLLERGHRHVAVINLRPDNPAAQTRIDRVVRFFKAGGITPLVIERELLTIDESIIEEIISELLAHTPRITGLFLPYGLKLVEPLYLALQQRGVRCGEDIDLISSNEYSRPLDPRLPTIDIQARELGRVAAETLLWRIQHPRAHRRFILIEPRLVEPALTNEMP